MASFKIPVIYYHSVAPQKHPNWPKRYLTMPLNRFETQLKVLKSEGFISLTISDYLELRKGTIGKAKYVVLTFDDGYLDNYVYLYPLLKKHGFKGTVFINPESVPSESIPRKTLIDYWQDRVGFNNLPSWGFMNWEEMRLLKQSEVIEIQSHTYSHTKYFVSDKLIGFHRPMADSLYYIGNLFPDRIPYHIGDSGFERLVPYGYPIFEQKSALISKQVVVNGDFVNETINCLKDHDWFQLDADLIAKRKTLALYEEYSKADKLIVSKESTEHYEERVIGNLKTSKMILDQQLRQNTNVCSWPHGDNSPFVHSAALSLGYIASPIGKMSMKFMDDSRFKRVGLGHSDKSDLLTKLQTRFRILSYTGVFPYESMDHAYHLYRNWKT